MPGPIPPLSRAMALHREGRPAEALACYDEVLAADADSADAWHLSGVACHQPGDHEQAVARLSRAAELAPGKAEFLANLGVAHYAAKHRERATEAWQRALGPEPGGADARFHLGVAAIWRPPMASPREDLDGFASLLAALDLVISVDNSTVHLAGALGVRTWVLLPFVADWRWGVRGSRSSWYAETVLYRQHGAAAWDDVLVRVARDLAGLISARD